MRDHEIHEIHKKTALFRVFRLFRGYIVIDILVEDPLTISLLHEDLGPFYLAGGGSSSSG